MYKFIKKAFNATITGFKGLQFCLILIALLTMIDFILQLMTIKLPEQIQAFFDTLYQFQSNFYKPHFEIIPVDFTLAVVAIELMIFAGLIVYIINFIIEFEQIYERVHQDGVRRYEARFNKNLEKKVEQIEKNNKQFTLYFTMKMEQVVDNFAIAEEKKVDIPTKMIEYRTLLRNTLLQNFKLTYSQLENGMLIYFKNFDDCNKIFDKIYEFSAQTKEELKNFKIKFRLSCAVCIANRTTDKETYLPKLQKLISIALPNKIMALADFKNKYEMLKEKPYKISGLGEYSLNNEAIDVFTLEK